MIKLDKVKLSIPLCNVELLDNEKWQTITQNGEIISFKFKQERPCLIKIEVHFNDDEVTMEFTGKILKDDYPLLMNKFTIRKCLDAINELGICKMKIEKVLTNSKVLKCDVTYDVCGMDLERFKNYTSTHIINHKKWNIRSFPHKNNFIIEKEVATARLRRKVTIYDKGAELDKRNNATFFEWVENPNEIINHFKGCVRFELSLVSCSAIRQELNVQDCDLISVLNSNENPICEFFKNVLRDDTTTIPEVNSMKLYDKMNTLIVNDWDLKAIEQKIRQLYPKSYHSYYLDDYRKLIDAHQKAKHSSSYDVSHFFEDTYVDNMTIKDVDANYWQFTFSDRVQYLTDFANGGMDFIVDVSH